MDRVIEIDMVKNVYYSPMANHSSFKVLMMQLRKVSLDSFYFFY